MRQIFVGRERELAHLQSHLDHAVAGHAQVVFVAGESGSGKTALLREFARRAEAAYADVVVAVGECNAQTGIGDPYLPLREILNELAGDVEAKLAQGAISQQGAARLRALVGVSAEALVELGPSLINLFVPGSSLLTQAGRFVAKKAGWLKPLQQLAERKPAAPGETSLDQNRIFEQYTNVLRAIAAKQPLVLVLDDLHWADAASISLLFYVGRRLGDARILIVGAYRPSEVALGRGGERHPLEKVLAELKRYSGDVVIDLSQGEEAEGRRFVDSLLDSEPNDLGPEFHEALYSQTGGQALFTVELLRMLQERGDLRKDAQGRWIEGPELDWTGLPARVEGVIEERIGRLEDDLRQTLRIASVEGRDFTAEVVAQIRAMRELEVLRSLSEELEKKHRLVEERGVVRLLDRLIARFQFSHALFQRYLYNDLGDAEKRLLHGEVARVLEALYAACLDDVAVQLARHYAEAGDADKAIAYLLKAGDRARGLFANREAIDHYQRALALYEADPLPARSALAAQLYEGLGDVQFASAQTSLARESFTRALSLTGGDDCLRRARLNRKLGISVPVGETDMALAYFAAAEAALGQAPETMPSEWQQEWLEAQCERLNALLWKRRLQEMTDLADKTRPFVERWGSARQRARFYDELAVVGLTGDRWVASGATLAYIQAAVAASRESGDQILLAFATQRLALCHLWRGELDEAERAYQAALRLAESLGYVRGQAMALGHLASVYRMRGQIQLVKRDLPRALDLAESADLPAIIGTIYGHLAWVAWREGRLADVQTHGRAALKAWLRHQSPDAGLAFFPLLAAALAQGRVDEAIDCARRMLDVALLRLPEALEAPLQRAIVAWDAGQAEAAQVHLRQAVHLAQQGGGYL